MTAASGFLNLNASSFKTSLACTNQCVRTARHAIVSTSFQLAIVRTMSATVGPLVHTGMLHRYMVIAIPSHLTNDELLTEIGRLRGGEREVTARLIAHLAELEARELYVPAGFSSLYNYCHEGLGYSEDAAYNRKTAAQVAHRYPEIIDMLADGRLSLTAVRILAPVLNDENHREAFVAAAGKPKSEVEKVAAWLAPRPDVPSSIRKLPARNVAAVPERKTIGDPPSLAREGAGRGDALPPGLPGIPPPRASERRPEVAPLAPDRYRVQFTIGEETERKLRRIQELLKREVPNGDPAVIFDRALTLLLEKVEARKNGLAPKPRAARASKPGSRHMPAAVRRDVHRRDTAQCAFVAANGRRCTERAFIEYHHARVPFAHGGEATVENIRLHCRTHNAHEEKLVFGRSLPPEVREARAAYEAAWTVVPERLVAGNISTRSSDPP